MLCKKISVPHSLKRCTKRQPKQECVCMNLSISADSLAAVLMRQAFCSRNSTSCRRKAQNGSKDTRVTYSSLCSMSSLQCVSHGCWFRDAKRELQRSTAAAASSKLEMENRIHELEMVTISKTCSMGSQISQLEQQISALESDKETALRHAADLTAEMGQVKKQASSKDQANENLQLEIRDQQCVCC